MKIFQSIFGLFAKPIFILTLLLLGFFFKEVFVVSMFPIFNGQDEYRHYSTIQFLNEPKEKTWPLVENKEEQDYERLETYRFSEEIKEAAEKTESFRFRTDSYNKHSFSDGYLGRYENEINEKKWETFNRYQKPDKVSRTLLYHKLALPIERLAENQSILVRYFSIRIFSAFLGSLVILFSYLIFKTIGFREKISLSLTTIVAFQPKLSVYFSNINYDALLIPLFTLFILGVALSLKNGLTRGNTLIMFLSLVAGFFTKGPSIILLFIFIGLLLFHLYRKIKNPRKKASLWLIPALIVLILIIFQFTNFKFLSYIPHEENLPQTISSFKIYLAETTNKIKGTSRGYWGVLDWTHKNFSNELMIFIWIIEALAIIGIIRYLFSKKSFSFLPEKKYVVMLIIFFLALQAGIRIYDWRVFIRRDEFLLGTPGRYFLPAITAQISLIFIGLGALLRNRKIFGGIVTAGMIFMFTLCLYTIFNVILPRYYL